ncbi:phage protein Gp27 family protein [Sneathiella sp.]|uniref:phage protein Gp27 family protein n=1 Tax=Sneathiella sp. TaxID=1964365 RepID=UPI002FE288B0
MGRKSSVTALPPAILKQVQLLIQQGRTIDDITAHLNELDQDVSRSAVGRYARDFSASLKKYQDAQQVAGLWLKQLAADPSSDVGMLLGEMLKTLAFQTLADMGEGDSADPKDIMFLAKSIKDIEGANKLSIEREQRIRERVAKEVASAAADAVDAAAREAGLSAATAAAIRSSILGLRK